MSLVHLCKLSALVPLENDEEATNITYYDNSRMGGLRLIITVIAISANENEKWEMKYPADPE